MEKVRVFLAEDHVVVREGFRELICREPDMEVVGEAGDGAEAVRLAAELRPDVVLMDIAMPALSGIEATRQIKRALPQTCVLALTAYDSSELVAAIIEAGATGYLLKNVRGKELVSAIRSACEGEAVLCPAVAQRVFAQFLPDKKPPADKGEPLSQRELEVLRLGIDGLSNKQIATSLGLGPRTVQTHWRNIFNKLAVCSRTEAIVHCLKKGWVTLQSEGE